MFGRKVIPPRRTGLRRARWAYASFGGDYHLLPHARDFLEDRTKYTLSFSRTIDVRVVEQRVARLICGDDRALTGRPTFGRDLGGIPTARDSPATIGQAAASQGTDTQ